MTEITVEMLRKATPVDIKEGEYVYVQNELDEEIHDLRIVIKRDKKFFTSDGTWYTCDQVHVLKEEFKNPQLQAA